MCLKSSRWQTNCGGPWHQRRTSGESSSSGLDLAVAAILYTQCNGCWKLPPPTPAFSLLFVIISISLMTQEANKRQRLSCSLCTPPPGALTQVLTGPVLSQFLINTYGKAEVAQVCECLPPVWEIQTEPLTYGSLFYSTWSQPWPLYPFEEWLSKWKIPSLPSLSAPLSQWLCISYI